MATIKSTTCDICGVPFTGILNQTICPRCLKERFVQAKVDWLAERRYDEKKGCERSLEERVAWIEEWIYDHKDLATKRLLEDSIPF